MQVAGCILGLIGGIGFLPLLGWSPWADENDVNQACKLPVASASCPIGGWRPQANGHDDNQACKLLGASSGSSVAPASRPICGWRGRADENDEKICSNIKHVLR